MDGCIVFEKCESSLGFFLVSDPKTSGGDQLRTLTCQDTRQYEERTRLYSWNIRRKIDKGATLRLFCGWDIIGRVGGLQEV